MTSALPALLDGQHLVATFGFVGLLLIVFAETGLLLGFFLPGDSLLFAAGYAATGHLPGLHLSLAAVLLGVPLVAIAGAQTGFLIGRAAGPALFDRRESRLFKRAYVVAAEETVQHYGAGKAIVLARFIPIVRTFLNPLLGAGSLPLRTFALWNVVGGLLWGLGVTLLGFWLGRVPFIGKNLEFFAVAVVLLSVVPMYLEWRRTRRT